MDIDARQLKTILEALATTVIANAAELGELDRAIGDGDLGVNLRRGFTAVGEHVDEVVALPPDKVRGVKARGKAEVGQKTLLDVLVPVLAELQAGGVDLVPRLRACAAAAAVASTAGERYAG